MDEKFIYLGYSELTFPYFYVKDGQFTGVLAEIGGMIANFLKRDIAFKRYRYPDPSLESIGIYTNSLAAIQNGSILTSIDGLPLVLGENRVNSFRYSIPLYYTQGHFYEACPDPSIANSRLTYYTVFSLNAFALLIACRICFLLIEGINYCIQKDKPIPDKRPYLISEFLLCISNIFIVMAVTLVTFHYSAGFNGNNFILTPAKTTTFSEILSGLRSGTRTIITSMVEDYVPAEIDFLLGPNSSDKIKTTGNLSEVVRSLCFSNDLNYVARLFDGDFLTSLTMDQPCRIKKIPLLPVSEVSADLLKASHPVSYYLLFSRELTKPSFVKIINQVLLRLFQVDQLDNIYTKRFMTNLRSQRFMEEKPVIAYLSMSLTRLQLIFYVFLVLISLSFIEFVSEIIYYRYITRKSKFST